MTPDLILAASVLSRTWATGKPEVQVAALLSCVPEDYPRRVVIEQTGPDEPATLRGLRQAHCVCSEAAAGEPNHPKAHHRLTDATPATPEDPT